MNRWLTLGLCLAAASAFAAPADTDPGAEELYLQLKIDGQAIPAWLNEAINPRTEPGGSRQGGDTQAEAVAITFSPGGTYSDAGTTVGYANDYDSAVAATLCQVGTFFSSSFGAADVYYTFTLPGQYEVTADICGASFDSALGIVDAGGTLVGYNDDGGGCATSTRSRIPACCLPAGTYYIVVDGYGTNTGTYTLNVEFGADACLPPCDTYAAHTVAITAPDVATGSTVGEPNVYGGTAGDAGIDITIPYGGRWNIDACSANTDYAADIYLFTDSPCDGGALITSSTSATCTAGVASTGRLLNLDLPAGVYHLLVGHTSTTEGAFEVSVYESAAPTAGGPDAFGYVWYNSVDEDGPAYDWVDITGVGTPVTFSGGDSYAGPFAIGMAGGFDFYGVNYTQFYLSSDGFLSFNALTSSYYSNQNIPLTNLPNNVIAAFWDDLYWTSGVGQAFTYYDSVNDRMIIEYSNFTKSSRFVTFEIILKADGTILIQHQTLPVGYVNSATLGVENDGGTTGLAINYNATGGALFSGLATMVTIPEGDEFGPTIAHTPLGSSEATGPFAVDADITDAQSDVAGADLYWQMDGGGYSAVAMTAGTPPAWSAAIPAQPLGATVDYYIVATDTAVPANSTTSPTWTFVVQDWTAAPQNLVASDDLIERVTLTWQAPAWAHPQAAAGAEPELDDFVLRAASKAEGLQAWQAAHEAWEAAIRDASRSFTTYVVYRDGDSLTATTALTYTDNGLAAGDYDYEVTALFDAGESDPAADTGTALPRPTSGGPDALGYTWVNSLDAEGTTFAWTDITLDPNALPVGTLSDDGYISGIAMGITFPFYTSAFTAVNVAMNGFINFGAGNGSLSNQLFPNATTPNAVIAPFSRVPAARRTPSRWCCTRTARS